MKRIKVSNNVIRRMPRYLRKLDDLNAAGIERISSGELGRQMGLTPSQIRQDFSCFGEFGQQGYGYNVVALRGEVARSLAWIATTRPFWSASATSAARWWRTSASSSTASPSRPRSTSTPTSLARKCTASCA